MSKIDRDMTKRPWMTSHQKTCCLDLSCYVLITRTQSHCLQVVFESWTFPYWAHRYVDTRSNNFYYLHAKKHCSQQCQMTSHFCAMLTFKMILQNKNQGHHSTCKNHGPSVVYHCLWPYVVRMALYICNYNTALVCLMEDHRFVFIYWCQCKTDK